MVPARAPSTAGTNTIVIVQLLPAAMLLPQVVVVTRKSPVAIGATRPVDALPVFVAVMVWLALCPSGTVPKSTAVAESPTTACPCPFPLKATVCVPNASVRTSVPAWAPDTVGAKVMDSVHDAPIASEVPQELVAIRKFASPLMLCPFIVSTAVPELDICTICAALILPTPTLPNANVEGATVTFATPWPVPYNRVVATDPLKVSDRVMKPFR